MSLYGQYVRERGIDNIVELPMGFATYRYPPGTNAVYIVDIYVAPDCRKSGIASDIAAVIAREAKVKGCTEMWGTVAPQARGSTDSLRVLLAFGMELSEIRDGLIVFKKGI